MEHEGSLPLLKVPATWKVQRPYLVLPNSHGHAKEFLRNLYKSCACPLEKFPRPLPVCFVIYSYDPPVWPPYPRVPARNPLDPCLWNVTLGACTKIFRGNPNLVKGHTKWSGTSMKTYLAPFIVSGYIRSPQKNFCSKLSISVLSIRHVPQ